MIKRNLFQAPWTPEAHCHGGKGTVQFRRVLESEFQCKISFLDYTIVPPGASIGYHRHTDTEEVYVILQGCGRMMVDGEEAVVTRGDVVLNPRGGTHGLVNTGTEDVEILVFEGRF